MTLSVPVAPSDELLARPQAFDFEQAVRLLEMLRPDAVPVGEGSDPQAEPVRFRSSFSLGFPASEIQDLRTGAGGVPELSVNFLGVGGVLGPLPHALTEWVLSRNGAKDFALRDFLDLFNHRLVSIWFRARRQGRLGMQWSTPEEQRFADYLRAVIGLLGEGLQERMALPDRALLRYAGLLSKRPRDVTGLGVLLRDHFGVPVEIRPHRGAFRALDPDRHTLLGAKGQNRALGETTLLGTRVWDQQAGLEVRLGPLPFRSYTDFLPGRPGHTALRELVRFYVGPGLDLAVTLVVQGEDIPPARLGQGSTAVLGQAAFLSFGSRLRGVFTIALGVLRAFSQPPEAPAAPAASQAQEPPKQPAAAAARPAPAPAPAAAKGAAPRTAPGGSHGRAG